MSLKNKMVSGIKWSATGVIFRALFQLLQLSILTRFLSKEDFGLVAMALVVVQFSNIFSELGMTSAILNRQDTKNKEYSSIYWLNLFVSLFLYIMIFGIKGIVSSFYNEPDLKMIIPILGINIIFLAIGRQHRTLMQKNLQFKAISTIELSSYFIGLIVAVTLAINGYGVYSLVFSTLASSLFSNLLFLFRNIRNYPIMLHFKFAEAKPFLKVGGYSTGSSILDFFSSQADIFIIGKTMGAADLGLYSLFKELVLRVYSIINPILLTVFSPVLAGMQKDKEKISFYYLKILNLLSTFNCFLYLFMVALSAEIILIVYGSSFVIHRQIFIFLLISYCINTLNNPLGSLQIATGRTDLGFKWTVMRLLITPIVIYYATTIDLTAIAASQALLSILFLIPVWYIQLKPMTNIPLIDYCKQFLAPLTLFFIFCLIYFINPIFNFQFSYLPLSITIKSIFVIIIYILFLYFFDKKRITDIVDIIKSFLKSLKIQ